MLTTSVHGKARIVNITPGRVESSLAEGNIAIVAGFQGFSKETMNITTLGRGGSDTTAVALAAALHADVCEIYTDVDGVYTADPRIVPNARRLDRVTYEEMLELAACGAKILHLRSVEYGRRYGVPIHVRSSFSTKPGTDRHRIDGGSTRGTGDHQRRRARPQRGQGDRRRRAGQAGRGGGDLPRARRRRDQHRHDRAEHLDRRHRAHRRVVHAAGHRRRRPRSPRCSKVQDAVGFEDLLYDDHIGKLSLVGAGMRSHPGVSAKFFTALADAGVNVEMISTSEIRISVVCRDTDLDVAVRAVHDAFELGSRGRAGRRLRRHRPMTHR